MMAAQQNNLAALHSYCNSFFIRDVHGEFGLINVHLFDILLAISSGKVGDFFGLRSGNHESRALLLATSMFSGEIDASRDHSIPLLCVWSVFRVTLHIDGS